MEVRTRFAPSPTGSMHVGNARTAIFNWLFAKHHNGKFILRIEDTDQERSTKQSEALVIEDLKWLGITYDEGPYRQSERMDVYKELVDKLVEKGAAFYCFCTDEQLNAKREKAMAEKRDPIYDGTCGQLNPVEIQQKLADGVAHTIRFKVEPKNIIINDLIKGKVNIKKGMFGDFVILRSNGMPVYNFAVVVDDALMKITHIIRAEEHLANSARQILLYIALGFNVPQFAHTALILAQDGSKLSKRDGAVSVEDYRKQGYLPDALFNYLSILGWTHPEEKEKLSKEGIYSVFNVKKISKSSAKFDQKKLNWLNGEYIKELTINEFEGLVAPYIQGKFAMDKYDKDEWIKIYKLAQVRIDCLQDVQGVVSTFFEEPKEIADEWKEDAFIVLKNRLAEEINKVNELTEEFMKEVVKNLGKELSLKGKNLFAPIRQFITGQIHGPDLNVVASILGKEQVLKRLALWD